MIKAGIIGGAGYTAGELLRILLHHEYCEITFIHSSSHAGHPVSEIHSDLVGDTDLRFTNQIFLNEIDVVFLCMGHGLSLTFFENNEIPEQLKIIDLSHDFRLKREGNPFVYGLPELNKEQIKQTSFIANPGCFATGIQLGLLPLAANAMLSQDVHVHAITGSTGAGQKPSPTTHFSWREGNLSAYKIFSHQHLGEINQSIKQLQSGYTGRINFIPIRGNHTRGIFTTMYTPIEQSFEEIVHVYKSYYQNHPFVHLSEVNPTMKQVVNTNKALIYCEKHDQNLVIITVTDNLIKGASGQAVQNMNLMFGLKETTGLQLKATVF